MDNLKSENITENLTSGQKVDINKPKSGAEWILPNICVCLDVPVTAEEISVQRIFSANLKQLIAFSKAEKEQAPDTGAVYLYFRLRKQQNEVSTALIGTLNAECAYEILPALVSTFGGEVYRDCTALSEWRLINPSDKTHRKFQI